MEAGEVDRLFRNDSLLYEESKEKVVQEYLSNSRLTARLIGKQRRR
jgi:hypothetical protein